MKRSLYTLIATLVVSASAHSAWVLEPLVGYQMGSFSTTAVGSTTSVDKSETGTLAGLRFNHIFGNRIMLGLNYQMISGGKLTPSSGTATDMTKSEAYVTFGYNAGRWNAYLGYAPTATMGTSQTEVTSYTYSGTAAKAGFSFDFTNHFGMGVEYIMPTYTTIDPKMNGSATLSDTYSKMSVSSYNVNFSFPFVF